MRPELKYAVIEKHKEKYPISAMCTFFCVSRSGYYACQRRTTKRSEETIVQMIRECQARVDYTYGYRRVGLWLNRQGVYANHKRVYRLMEKYGLFAQIRRRRKFQQMSEFLHRYPNVLNRNFSARRPNEKWVTDISYIDTPQGTLYLSVIRDLFDSSIVAYKMGTQQSVNLVLQTLRQAKQKETVAAELQLHSDQGFQYTSQAYFTLTQEYGIIPSMSRRGNCYDNAVAENFFGILKSECLRRHKPQSLEHAKLLIDNFIFFYNNERIQLKTKLTPLEKRRQLL